MSTPLHTPSTTGRRGTGAPTPGRQPDQPHRHATGRRAAADPQHPVVSAHRPSAAPQRGGHCERHSPDRATGPTSGGWDCGPHPRQPSGPRRRNRLASEWEQRLRLDFQHPHRTLLPAGGGRGKAVVDEALSESFSGVLVSDCYAAYHHYDGPKQRCWAHLLRDIHDLVALYPKDTALAQWAAAVHQLYVEASSMSRPGLSPILRHNDGAPLNWPGSGSCWSSASPSCQPFLADPLALQGRLCRRIAAPHQEPAPYWIRGTLRLRGRTGRASGQQRRRAQPAPSGRQPEGQRRHPVGTGQRQQDDPGLLIWHLAGPRTEPPHHLPTTALFPSTLSCYQSPANVTGAHRLRRQPTKPDENAGLGQPPALPQPCVTIPCILHGKAPVAVLNCSVEDDRV